MKITVKWKGKNKIRRAYVNMRSLDTEGVDYGYFASQGMHPEAGMNYPSLMAVHELRTKGDYAKRPVFQRTLESYGHMITNNIRTGISRYIVNSPHRLLPTHKLFASWGEDGVNITRTGFGDTAMLTPNTESTARRKGGRNEPLVEWGHLKDALSYRTTFKRKVFTPYG